MQKDDEHEGNGSTDIVPREETSPTATSTSQMRPIELADLVPRIEKYRVHHRIHACSHIRESGFVPDLAPFHMGSDDHGAGVINFFVTCGDPICQADGERIIQELDDGHAAFFAQFAEVLNDIGGWHEA